MSYSNYQHHFHPDQDIYNDDPVARQHDLYPVPPHYWPPEYISHQYTHPSYYHHSAPSYAPPPRDPELSGTDPNPSILATGPRMSLAGSLDPSTGIFYRTPEHPRLRTAQACEKCRTRKAKCSGDHPSCKRCTTRGLICEYAKEGRVRGPNKPKIKPVLSPAASSTAGSVTSTSPPLIDGLVGAMMPVIQVKDEPISPTTSSGMSMAQRSPHRVQSVPEIKQESSTLFSPFTGAPLISNLSSYESGYSSEIYEPEHPYAEYLGGQTYGDPRGPTRNVRRHSDSIGGRVRPRPPHLHLVPASATQRRLQRLAQVQGSTPGGVYGYETSSDASWRHTRRGEQEWEWEPERDRERGSCSSLSESGGSVPSTSNPPSAVSSTFDFSSTAPGGSLHSPARSASAASLTGVVQQAQNMYPTEGEQVLMDMELYHQQRQAEMRLLAEERQHQGGEQQFVEARSTHYQHQRQQEHQQKGYQHQHHHHQQQQHQQEQEFSSHSHSQRSLQEQYQAHHPDLGQFRTFEQRHQEHHAHIHSQQLPPIPIPATVPLPLALSNHTAPAPTAWLSEGTIAVSVQNIHQGVVEYNAGAERELVPDLSATTEDMQQWAQGAKHGMNQISLYRATHPSPPLLPPPPASRPDSSALHGALE